MKQANDAGAVDPRWRSLYRIGGAAVVATLIFYLTQIVVLSVGDTPFPSTANDWFNLFQSNRLQGLFYINALDMVSVALQGVMFLALYMALRKINESYTTVALFFAMIGVPVFIAPRSATFSLLALSDQYAAATTDAQRSLLLAAGESLGALGQPTPQTVGFICIAVAALIMSVVMLRSGTFSKWTAYLGILASIFTFVDFISLIIVPSIADLLMMIAMLPWLIWWILVARRLFQLGAAS